VANHHPGVVRPGASAGELHGDPACRIEIAELWSAIERSVEVINSSQAGGVNLQDKAA